MNKPKLWLKTLEGFINDEESFVLKQKRIERNTAITMYKETSSKICDPSDGTEELNRLAMFNTNELDMHGTLYDMCNFDLFREQLSNSFFKRQNMSYTARLIYLLDWFVNDLKDNKVYMESYDSLYQKQFEEISRYNDHNDFNKSFRDSEEYFTEPALKHMTMVREYLEWNPPLDGYYANNLVKFVISYIYSVLEKDYDTTAKVSVGVLPDWLLNFVSHTEISIKTMLLWDEIDDESSLPPSYEETMLEALRTLTMFLTYPDVSDKDVLKVFSKENDARYVAFISIMSYIHALMSYGIAIYNTFIGEHLRSLWCYPDCIVDYIYSIYQHARIDEAMIRYSSEIERVAVMLSQCSMNDIFTKLEAPISNNNIPYKIPFSEPNIPSPSQQPHFDMRLNQLETTVASLIGDNAELKSRIEKLEGTEQFFSSFPKSSRGNFCIHNDYIVYVYKNGYPRVNVENFNSNEAAKAIREWKDDLKRNVSNFDPSDDAIVEYDDGTVLKCRCKLCGEQFVIDRRLIKPNKQ